MEGRERLQDSLDGLTKWTEEWLMQFNEGKCKVIHMGKNNPHYQYYLNKCLLEKTDAEKDLGVIIDKDLSFDMHISESVKRASKIAGLILRIIHFNNQDILVPLFKALVRPILEYGNPVWNPLLKKHTHAVEDVQRRFTKRISGFGNKSYEQRLAELKLPSLEYRRIRGDLIEAYKIMNKLYDPKTTEDLVHLSLNTHTRGHSFKLEKQSTNTRLYQNFFTNRINTRWNNLPVDCVAASTVNSFKNRIDKIFSDIKYSTDISK